MQPDLLLFVATTAAVVTGSLPTNGQFTTALNIHCGGIGDQVRRIDCYDAYEEPTQYFCSYEVRRGRQWKQDKAELLSVRHSWKIIDKPSYCPAKRMKQGH